MSSRKKPVLDNLDDNFIYQAGKNLGEFASTDPVPKTAKKPTEKKPEPPLQALTGGMGQYPGTKAK